jgi:hypothetical protein
MRAEESPCLLDTLRLHSNYPFGFLVLQSENSQQNISHIIHSSKEAAQRINRYRPQLSALKQAVLSALTKL